MMTKFMIGAAEPAPAGSKEAVAAARASTSDSSSTYIIYAIPAVLLAVALYYQFFMNQQPQA